MKKQTQRPDRLARFLLCVLCASVAGVPSAAADYVTEGFSGTVGIEDVGTVLKFDLSAIPAGAKVHRALLKIALKGRDYRRPITFNAIVKKGQALEAGTALPLRPPFFQDLDATDLVRQWVAKPDANLGLQVASAPNWQQGQTQLLVSYDGKSDKPTQAVTGVEAAFQDGQVFLRFKEIEDVVAAEEIKFGDFEAKVLDARKRRGVTYRVYRSDKPIAAATLGSAELMREIKEVLPAYNLDAVQTTEFPGQNSRPSKLEGLGGNRRTDQVVARYRLPMEKQLVTGENLCVMTSRKDGSFYYAVTAVVDGREAVKLLPAGATLDKPVAEKVQPVAPLLQGRKVNKGRDNKEEWVYEDYVCFYDPPYWPVPLAVYMVSTYCEAQLVKPKAPLEFCCGIYGGQTDYNLGRRYAKGGYYVAPPLTGPMWQGLHECHGTLRSYADGLVRNYPKTQIFALIEWAKKRWNIDDDRVVINGQFVLWGLRHPDVFAAVYADPYGNYAAGKEQTRHNWAWGPWPAGSANEDGNVDQWEYMNLAKYIRENPDKELPFYCGSPSGATHVGDMGFMPCPETYKALLDSRRSFAARWGHSLGTGAPAAAALPVRKSQPLPAFSNCSLDDMIGEGDQWGGAGGGTIGSGDPTGQFNNHLRWDLDKWADQPDKVEFTVWLDASAPKDACTADFTPRRCRQFKPKPGESFTWKLAAEDGQAVASNKLTADKWGLVTVPKLEVTKARRVVTVSR